MAERSLGLLWNMADSFLGRLSKRLQRIVRTLRIIRVLLVIGVLAVLSSALVGLLWPRWFPIAYAVGTIFLVIPLVLLVGLVAAPLRAKSVVRLIDQGYPANARELAIRAVARKLHDESIETEELLVDTALNEGRKLMRKFKDQELARAVADDEARQAP
ncbi:MAG: hypothetical protein AABX89_04035 [Candidatus Thermoplasmatota archaeon]